jgi:DNA-binding transcriptional MerR regulator
MKSRTYQISEVAELSGVTIRALHHYDAIGLLVPSLRTPAGYRLYGDDDLLRSRSSMKPRRRTAKWT